MRGVYYEKAMQTRLFICCVWHRLCACVLPANRLAYANACFGCNCTRHNHLLQKVGVFMKVVLFKSPKLIAPLLRMVFGVKKIHYQE